MDDFEKELKDAFIEEALQLLTEAEQGLISLETNQDKDTLNKLFRLAHNVKGSSRAVGFLEVGEFTHVYESLLLKLKEGQIPITTKPINALLEGTDHLKNWIESLRGNFDHKVDSSKQLAMIQDAMIDGATNSTQSSSAPTAAEVAELTRLAESVGSSTPTASPATTVAMTSDPTVSVQESLAQQAVGVVQASLPSKMPAAAKPAQTPNQAAQNDEQIRVSSKKLERLLNQVGELVILQTVLNQQRDSIESQLIRKTVVQLGKITKEIQDVSMSLKMVPLKTTFQKMQRIVRDLSKALNKEMNLELTGEDTELDKTIVDLLGDPLVHLVRNSGDHGIEDNEERIKLGKPKAGKIELKAYHRGGNTIIDIIDDGRGLDPEKLRKKAIEKGVISATTVLTDKEAQSLIFAAGFSTKDKVTEISGRGVGMDVVKTNIESNLQGKVELESEKGKGTCVRITLPLTLAIIDGMVLKSGDDRYIVPISQIHEALQPPQNMVSTVTGVGEVLTLREEALPLYRLPTLLGRGLKTLRPATDSIAVVVNGTNSKFSILVDDILGQQQVVIKQLGKEIGGLKGVSGGAVLGDGRAALILDLLDLTAHLQNQRRATA